MAYNNSMIIKSNASHPFHSIVAPIVTIDWQAEEVERERKMLGCLFFFCNLFMLFMALCGLLLVRWLRQSHCLTRGQAEELIEKTMGGRFKSTDNSEEERINMPESRVAQNSVRIWHQMNKQGEEK
jgi:hypothetical protein